MKKIEIIDAMASAAGITKPQAKAALDSALECIANDLVAGNSTQLLGFGTFAVAAKAARKGLNPQTKEVVEIPARKVVKFKPGKDLAEKVKNA